MASNISSKNYLDYTGLSYFKSKLDTLYDSKYRNVVKCNSYYLSYNNIAAYYNGQSVHNCIRVHLPDISPDDYTWAMMTYEFTVRQDWGSYAYGKMFVHGVWSSASSDYVNYNYLRVELSRNISTMNVYAKGKDLYITGLYAYGGLSLDRVTCGDNITTYDIYNGIELIGESDVATGAITASKQVYSTLDDFNDYLPLAGGTMTGNLAVNGSITGGAGGVITGTDDTAFIFQAKSGYSYCNLIFNDGSGSMLGNLGFGADKRLQIYDRRTGHNGWKEVALLEEVLPLSGGTLTGPLYYENTKHRISQEDGTTLTRYNGNTVSLAASSANSEGIAILVDEGNDYGLLYVGSDGCSIHNSGDCGYLLSVYDKDATSNIFRVGQYGTDSYFAGNLKANDTILINYPDWNELVTMGYLRSDYASAGYPTQDYLQAICKYLIVTYENQGMLTFTGNVGPNSYGTCIINLYSDSGKDSTTNVPRYCAGMYQELSGYLVHFGFLDYSWHFEMDAHISQIPTNLNQLTNGPGYVAYNYFQKDVTLGSSYYSVSYTNYMTKWVIDTTKWNDIKQVGENILNNFNKITSITGEFVIGSNDERIQLTPITQMNYAGEDAVEALKLQGDYPTFTYGYLKKLVIDFSDKSINIVDANLTSGSYELYRLTLRVNYVT